MKPRHPYGKRSLVLHWAAVALVVCVFVYSGQFSQASPATATARLAQHNGYGLALLLLMLLRVWWRTRTADPLSRYQLPALQLRAARTVHYTLYVLLLAQCFIGLGLTVLGEGGGVFGWVTFDGMQWLAEPPALARWHAWLANTLLALVALHLLAAITHLIFGVTDDAES